MKTAYLTRSQRVNSQHCRQFTNEFVEKEKWFEKEIRPSLKGTPKDLPYMQFLFYNTKEEFKADQLFEENEIIKIRQNSFEQILEKLETYNLSDTQDDVKGIAFEQFLGTTFRGELGQYFTPRKIKWHTHRGTSMINYVDFADLANIMGQNYDLFEVHIVSLEWAKQIFTTLEKSRNVIMHSGELGERDIERIGINIRDWISQVGA